MTRGQPPRCLEEAREKKTRAAATCKMKRAKRSVVWDHFEKKGENNATCKHCESVYTYNTTTTAMLYHLNNVHSDKLAGSSSSHLQQPTIGSMFARRSCDPQRAEKITQSVCAFIEKDMMPISMVDGEGFRQMMHLLEPAYHIPSRGTITSRIEKRYTDAKSELLAQLANVTAASKVALTTDSWTALTTESYVTVTCHYIAEDWRVTTAVLLTRSLPGRHTADHLTEQLKEAVNEWGLEGKVMACVHDNARNITLANDPSRVAWYSVACFAHTLQLAINDGFTIYLKKVISAAGRLVGHFNHSTVATKALEEKQQQMALPHHRLIQSTKTRWNSVCEMFDRLVEQRWAVVAVLSDRTVTKLPLARTLELKEEYWSVMEDAAPVLASLKCATTVMSAESSVSISNTYPVTFGLINGHLVRKEEDCARVVEFKGKVRSSLIERMMVSLTFAYNVSPCTAVSK